MNKMGNVKDRLPKLPTEGNALSPDDRERTITPIEKLTPSRLKGNNPPTCFVTDDHYGGIITFDLVDNDADHNAYLVSYKVDPDESDIMDRQMLYYWKKRSRMQGHISEMSLIDYTKRWTDSLIITRLDKWKYLVPNWIQDAIHRIRDANGNAVDFEETF